MSVLVGARDPGEGLLVFAPLRLEAMAMGRLSAGAQVVRTGAGPARARAAAERARAARRPAAVAVAGVAGGLRPGMWPGTLVVADRVLDSNGSLVAELPSAPVLAGNLARSGLAVEVGPLACSDRLVRGADARRELAATGAIAVDMESASLLSTGWDCPVAVVRAVVDTPENELLSPATIAGARKALSALRRAAPVLEAWAEATGPRLAVLAGPRSFCAGVERAIATVERALERFGTPVYVRRQIVHNRHVVEDLEARGAVFVHELDQVPDGATVVFSAHGVAPAVRSEAARRGLRVVDATCPLVAKVHHEVRRFTSRGYQVVLIGHSGHDETEGTLGEDGGVTLVENERDVAALKVADPDRLAYITQTTLSPADVASMVDALSKRFPRIIGPHSADICYATQNRQEAVEAIAPHCDLLIVLGSANSSNTTRLVEVAARAGCRAVMVDDEAELDLGWLQGVSRIGITAGASAPPALVERLLHALSGLGPLEVREQPIRQENVNFPLPQEVR